jgi:hypothetical protein
VLCVVRLLTGLVVVYLHATLALDLAALFAAGGLLPVDEIAPLESATFSYLNYLQTPGELWAVHSIGLAILILFTVGFWTRLATILALVVFLSDVNRAPMITSLTESVVAMVMLYLCLAPCGKRFSIDALLAKRRRRPELHGADPENELSTMATIATRLIQVHLALLVAMMGYSKLLGEVWWSGMGMWWLLTREQSRLVDLTGLYRYPGLIEAWTHVVVTFELAFPILVWVPLARPLVLAIGVVVWASLALVTGDVPFALMMCVAGMAYVSPSLVAGCCRKEPSGALAAS